MSWWRCPEGRGFTLVELMVALLVLTLALSALAIPLAAQIHARRLEDARRQLDEAREALLGFAVAHGRLPCPATAASRGQERFASGGSAADGACETFHGGYLPAAALGLSALDAEGFARDPWGTSANRLRYAVWGGDDVNGIRNALTRGDGMRAASLAGLGAAPHYLFVCASGARADASGCGPAASQLTRRAAVVLVSPGLNAVRTPPAGSDEWRNLDGDAVFVSREASMVAGEEFDDLVAWLPIHLVIHRMVSAGRLP
jgi:prepilin-type N-terminal cleavage/methylation domain-containing protein